MRKLGEILLGTVLVLTITGIIPALLVGLVFKYTVLQIAVVIIAIVMMFYEIAQM